METPSRTRAVLGDITTSARANSSPRRPYAHRAKHSPLSPSVPQSKSAGAMDARSPAALRPILSAANEQRPHLKALWAATYPPLSQAQLQAEHARRLQAVIDFANLERSFAA